MHEDPKSLQKIQKEWHGTIRSYVMGFTTSLVLTAIAFFLVISKTFDGNTLIYTLAALAMIQAYFQLFYFLHLGEEQSPKWESIVFYFMLAILFIIAFGSIWIMNDLNARMMMDMPHD